MLEREYSTGTVQVPVTYIVCYTLSTNISVYRTVLLGTVQVPVCSGSMRFILHSSPSIRIQVRHLVIVGILEST